MTTQDTRGRARAAACLLTAVFLASACSQAASPGASAPASSTAAGDLLGSGTPPPLPPATAWDRALAGIDDDGRFSLDAALTLFATAYGPLPGVDVEQDRTGVTDTSIAIRAVMAHRDELTPEQLAAVERALEVPDGTDVVTIPPVGTARSDVTLAAFTKSQQESMRLLVEGYRWRIATLLGRDFLGDIKLFFFEQAGPAGAGADTWSDWPGGVFGDCRIRLFADFNAGPALLRDAILAHETFHCFQLDALRTIEVYSKEPAWVMEGQATWVAAYLVDDFVEPWWIRYLQAPTQPLTKRAYDAIGFYAHLAETGVNPWSVFVDMLLAGSDNDAIYTASRATTDKFLDSAASAVVLLPNLGTAWTTGGAGMVGTDKAYKAAEIGVGAGGRSDLFAPVHTSQLKVLKVDADLVHISSVGHARMSDGILDTTVLEDVWYCVVGHSCEPPCPGDGPAPVVRGTINARFLMALAGGMDGTTASIEGVDVPDKVDGEPCEEPEPSDDEFCKRYRDYVAWAEALGPDADVTQALAAEVARRFEGMWPVAPAELKQWVELVFTIYATFAGIEEPYNIPITGQVSGIQHLPEALQTMHAYCGIPWPGA